MMTEVGAGKAIYQLRKKIQKISLELNQLNNSSSTIPELIESTNLLRSNDHLEIINQKSSDLISAYRQYSQELENMLSMVFDIQKDLKEILKTQTSLIPEQGKTKKKSKKKSTKK